MSGLEVALAVLKGAGQVVSLATTVAKVIKGIKDFFEKEEEHKELSAKIVKKLDILLQVPDFLKAVDFGEATLFHDTSVQRFKAVVIECAEKCIELGKLGWFRIRLPSVGRTLEELDDLLSGAVEVYQFKLVGVITRSVQSMSERIGTMAKDMSEMRKKNDEMHQMLLDITRRLFQEENRKALDIVARHGKELESSKLAPPKYVDFDTGSLKEIVDNLDKTVRFNEAALKLTEPDSITWKDEYSKLVKWNDEIMPKLTNWEDGTNRISLGHARDLMAEYATMVTTRVPKPTIEDDRMVVPSTRHETLMTSTTTMSSPP